MDWLQCTDKCTDVCVMRTPLDKVNLLCQVHRGEKGEVEFEAGWPFPFLPSLCRREYKIGRCAPVEERNRHTLIHMCMHVCTCICI